MIQINVRYFAAFREQAGCADERVSTAAQTVGELFEELAPRHGLARSVNVKFGLNDDLAAPGARLSDGDSVLFFPPVAGG